MKRVLVFDVPCGTYRH